MQNFRGDGPKAYVLAMLGIPRNPNLIKELEKHMPVEIIPGIDASNNPECLGEITLSITGLTLNRELTLAERACTQGHRDMILRASEDRSSIALFLEDDAEIPVGFDFGRLTEDLFSERSLLCLISSNPRQILSKKSTALDLKSYEKCLSLPNCAQFYAINMSGIQKLAETWKLRECSDVADFPIWYWDLVDFILPPKSMRVEIVLAKSLIGNGRSKLRRSGISYRVKKFTCFFWFRYLRKYCSLDSYVAFTYGRLIVNLRNALRVMQ